MQAMGRRPSAAPPHLLPPQRAANRLLLLRESQLVARLAPVRPRPLPPTTRGHLSTSPLPHPPAIPAHPALPALTSPLCCHSRAWSDGLDVGHVSDNSAPSGITSLLRFFPIRSLFSGTLLGKPLGMPLAVASKLAQQVSGG